jgi:DNA-binding transcriptional MerR regulator
METPLGSPAEGSPVLRIGELSRHPGVSDHLLRAWESRYGLLRPLRSAGGFRLYSEADALRVRRMQAYLARGLSAAEAARAALGEDSGRQLGQGSAATAGPGQAAGPGRALAPAGELPETLRRALDAFDEPAAQAVLDRLMSDFSLTTVLREVVLPYLADLGQRWERIDYLGTNTPVEELTGAVAGRRPDLLVLAATLPEILEPLTAQLTVLARHAPLVLAGPGATLVLATAVRAQLLGGDPVTAAENVGWPR